jgi:hypothetical protein
MTQTAFRIGGLSLASALACVTSANAELLSHKDLSVAVATTIARTAIDTCKAQGTCLAVKVR